MPDGSWGYSAKQGLEGVLGGKDIDKINKKEGAMTPEKMREYLLNGHDEEAYSEAARCFAGWVLRVVDKNPSLLDTIKDDNELYELAKKEAEVEEFDLTGFMFGWAINAVRYVYSQKPKANPAIVEI